MYVKITSGSVDTYPYSIGQLRRDNPNTSFPKKIPDEMLESYGILPVTYTDMPDIDDRTQTVEQEAAPSLVSGAWTIGWTTTAKTAEEIAEYDADAALNVRAERDGLLAQSDWTQMNDSPLSNEAKTAWATYRQELRGITDSDAWPNLADDDWPVKP